MRYKFKYWYILCNEHKEPLLKAGEYNEKIKTINLGLFLFILTITSKVMARDFRVAKDGNEQLGSGKFIQCKRYVSNMGVSGISISVKTVFQLEGSKSYSRDSYFEKNPDTGALENQTGEPYRTVFGKMGTGGSGRSVPVTHEAGYNNLQHICNELDAWVE